MNTTSFRIHASGLSDRGTVREKNEDAYLVDHERGLYAVADGLGGHRGGGIAALVVIEHLPTLLDRRLLDRPGRPGKALRAAILDLNTAIRTSGQITDGLKGMGSTLACLLICGDRCYIATMGDSRVYRWRKGLTCLTKDHSLTALLVREGELSVEAAANHPAHGRLTRYLGMDQDIIPDVRSLRMKAGDRLLLCTDGVWNALPDKLLAEIAGQSDDTPATVCANLINAANGAGAKDNVTALLVAIFPGEPNTVPAAKTLHSPDVSVLSAGLM